MLRRLRTLAHAVLAVTPSPIKMPIYRRVFGFKIAPGAQIGVSMLDVDELELGPNSKIGHGNLMLRTKRVQVDEGGEIGYLNILRGGDEIHLDPYSTVLRFNVLNSIPDNDATTVTDPRLLIGPGAMVVSGHRLDFTDRIKLGKNVIIAGRNSSFWTHNRQDTRPIEIGDFCYVGSEVRVAPGAKLGDYSILAMGAVLSGETDGHQVLGGVPAKAIRATNEADEDILKKPTALKIPKDFY